MEPKSRWEMRFGLEEAMVVGGSSVALLGAALMGVGAVFMVIGLGAVAIAVIRACK